MDIYLPIAELSVNGAVIVALGLLVGLMSGLFGVGGGFLTTPLLIFYGIPPAVAVASSAPQVTGASFSGALAHYRRGGVDILLGSILVAGGIVGAGIGSVIFKFLQNMGQIDLAISLIYVFFLTLVGASMLWETVGTLRRQAAGQRQPRPNRRNLFAALPWKMRFRKAGLYISPIAPFAIGLVVGILTFLMGIGGGLIMVPVLIYILGMAVTTVVGTSLFQIVFTTAAITLLHAVQSKTVDIVLAALLLIGGVIGAQIGARIAIQLPPTKLRLALAVLVLLVAGRLFFDLTIEPDNLFSVQLEAS